MRRKIFREFFILTYTKNLFWEIYMKSESTSHRRNTTSSSGLSLITSYIFSLITSPQVNTRICNRLHLIGACRSCFNFWLKNIINLSECFFLLGKSKKYLHPQYITKNRFLIIFQKNNLKFDNKTFFLFYGFIIHKPHIIVKKIFV